MMSVFMELSGDRYRAMQKRVAEKRNKRGRVTQVGRTLPFTLEQYRAWLLSVLGSEQNLAPCFYCGAVIAIETLVTDHSRPLSRGGQLGIENLTACCQPCNDAKGVLTGYEFKSLLEALGEIGYEAKANVLSRLAKAEKLAGSHRRMMARKSSTEDHPRPTQYEGSLEDSPF